VAYITSVKTQALQSGGDEYTAQRETICRYLAPLEGALLDPVLAFLGSVLGFNIPMLGVRSFPQGNCTIITTPAPSAINGGGGGGITSRQSFTGNNPLSLNDCEFVIESQEENEEGDGAYLAPLLLTLGGVSLRPTLTSAANGSASINMVPFLTVSLVVRPPGVSLVSLRRLADVIQLYMSEPALMEGEEGGMLSQVAAG